MGTLAHYLGGVWPMSMVPAVPVLPSGDELDNLARIHKAIGHTGFVPKALRGDPGDFLGAILMGRALGLDLMVALREISVIDGRPTLSAAVTLALVRSRGHSVQFEEGATQCIAVGKRVDTGDEHTVVWTMGDAETGRAHHQAQLAKVPAGDAPSASRYRASASPFQ